MAQRTRDQQTLEERPPKMTYEEFLRWIPDGKQAEWVDGEVTILTTSLRHVRLMFLLAPLLATFVRMYDLGEVIQAPFQMRLRFRPSGREPDILFVRKANLHRIDRLWVEGPADFVVEFLSEETARTDLTVKLREYEQAGVTEYLIIDARDDRYLVQYHRLDADRRYQLVTPDAEGRYHSEMLPGFWFDPGWFRLEPLPTPEDVLFLIAPQAYDNWLRRRRQPR